MIVPHKNIPSYNYITNEWSYESFDHQRDFAIFLDSLFKEPGHYEFDESTRIWRQNAKVFEQNGYYINHFRSSKEYKEYWDKQKERCRKGVIYRNGDKVWYVTREYYMLLNFLKLFSNKEKNNKEAFCDVRDVQYHLALYEKRCEVHHKHGVLTKKRQMMSSYYHAAKMLNVYWFEKSAILRNLAGDEAYLTGDKGLWNYYNNYRDFLNQHTAWIRENNPNQELGWIQRREVLRNGIKTYTGKKSILTGTTFKRSPTAGVGGPAYYNYFEEAGTYPKLDKTYIYMKPQLESGPGNTTGAFFAAGSVGELKDCKPLKKFMEYPEENGFLGVINNFANKERIPKLTGLYIPEQWGMPGYIDEFGNSLVEEALEFLNKHYDKLEKELDTSDYQLYVSQHPRYLSEAFAYREVSKWPIKRIEKRQQEIKDRKLGGTSVELYEDDKGQIRWKTSDKKDVGYPVDPKSSNKEGVCIMYEKPKDNIKFGDYVAGVDNIEVGKTETSNSLFSVYIMRPEVEVTIKENGEIKGKRIEAEKIVFSYTGRIDSEDVNETNRIGEYAIRLYKAFTLCERNKPNFINHMIKKNLRHLLATEADVPIYKELDFNKNNLNQNIGIYMDATGKKQALCETYALQVINEEISSITKKDKDGIETGEVFKTYYGIDFIDDYWLLEELLHASENTDRLDAWRLACTLLRVWQTNNIKVKKIEYIGERKEAPQKKIRTIDMMGTCYPIYNNKKKKRLIQL